MINRVEICQRTMRSLRAQGAMPDWFDIEHRGDTWIYYARWQVGKKVATYTGEAPVNGDPVDEITRTLLATYKEKGLPKVWVSAAS